MSGQDFDFFANNFSLEDSLQELFDGANDLSEIFLPPTSNDAASSETKRKDFKSSQEDEDVTFGDQFLAHHNEEEVKISPSLLQPSSAISSTSSAPSDPTYSLTFDKKSLFDASNLSNQQPSSFLPDVTSSCHFTTDHLLGPLKLPHQAQPVSSKKVPSSPQQGRRRSYSPAQVAPTKVVAISQQVMANNILAASLISSRPHQEENYQDLLAAVVQLPSSPSPASSPSSPASAATTTAPQHRRQAESSTCHRPVATTAAASSSLVSQEQRKPREFPRALQTQLNKKRASSSYREYEGCKRLIISTIPVTVAVHPRTGAFHIKPASSKARYEKAPFNTPFYTLYRSNKYEIYVPAELMHLEAKLILKHYITDKEVHLGVVIYYQAPSCKPQQAGDSQLKLKFEFKASSSRFANTKDASAFILCLAIGGYRIETLPFICKSRKPEVQHDYWAYTHTPETTSKKRGTCEGRSTEHEQAAKKQRN